MTRRSKARTVELARLRPAVARLLGYAPSKYGTPGAGTRKPNAALRKVIREMQTKRSAVVF